LHVNGVKAELVLFDYAVNAAVARLADNLPGVFDRAAVPHRNQQIHYNALERRWRSIL
jgi:hypothetical protein